MVVMLPTDKESQTVCEVGLNNMDNILSKGS